MAQVEIPDEILAQLRDLATDDMRPAGMELAWLVAEEIRRRQEKAEEAEKKRIQNKERQQRHRDRNAKTPLRVTQDNARNALLGVTPPSPPLPSSPPPASPLLPPAPPSNPPTPTPTPTLTPTPSHAREEGDGLEVLPGVAEESYSPAFEAWWKLRKWGGPKGQAYTEWKAKGLNREGALRERVMAAVLAQVANKAAVEAAGGFASRFQDGCRWLKYRRWGDNLEDVPAAGGGPIATPEAPKKRDYSW